MDVNVKCLSLKKGEPGRIRQCAGANWLFSFNLFLAAKRWTYVSRGGFEPPTVTLRGYCSTVELAAHLFKEEIALRALGPR